MNSDRAKVVLESISKKFKLEWIFKNYSLEKKELGIPLESPEFQIEFDGDCSRWRIQLYPGGYNDTSANFVAAFLKLIDTKHENLIDTKHENLMVSWEFGLFNSKRKLMWKRFNSQPFKKSMSLGDDKVILRESLLRDISHDDILKIICNIIVLYKGDENILCCLPKRYVTNFDKMRVDGDFIDITIAVGGREFQAHKNILAARSPVFFSMFKNEMKEANSGRVKIEDIEPEVFEEFLKYIYTGNAKVEEYSFQLLAAADKYDVQDLKTLCEDKLIKNITEQNCFKMLVLSDRHSCIKLKEQALNFIASNTQSLSDELVDAFKFKITLTELFSRFQQ